VAAQALGVLANVGTLGTLLRAGRDGRLPLERGGGRWRARQAAHGAGGLGQAHGPVPRQQGEPLRQAAGRRKQLMLRRLCGQVKAGRRRPGHGQPRQREEGGREAGHLVEAAGESQRQELGGTAHERRRAQQLGELRLTVRRRHQQGLRLQRRHVQTVRRLLLLYERARRWRRPGKVG